MKTRYVVTTYSTLNGDGRTGVWLLMLSPIANAACGAWLFYRPGLLPWVALIGIATLTIGGAILLFNGRNFHSSVEGD